MPKVLQEGPYRFFSYSNEGMPREPAHVHVRSGSREAKVWLQPEMALADNHGFNSREIGTIVALVEKHRKALERAWHDHFGD